MHASFCAAPIPMVQALLQMVALLARQRFARGWMARCLVLHNQHLSIKQLHTPHQRKRVGMLALD